MSKQGAPLSKAGAVALAVIAAGLVVQLGGDTLISAGVLPDAAWNVLRVISYGLLTLVAAGLLVAAVRMVREAWARR